MAERAGFEPAVLSHTAFRERHHQPLGHLSAREDTKEPLGDGPPTSWPHPRRRALMTMCMKVGQVIGPGISWPVLAPALSSGHRGSYRPSTPIGARPVRAIHAWPTRSQAPRPGPAPGKPLPRAGDNTGGTMAKGKRSRSPWPASWSRSASQPRSPRGQERSRALAADSAGARPTIGLSQARTSAVERGLGASLPLGGWVAVDVRTPGGGWIRGKVLSVPGRAPSRRPGAPPPRHDGCR